MAASKISGAISFEWYSARSSWAEENIHPSYGSCDLFADGDCAECRKQWAELRDYASSLEDKLKTVHFLLEDFCSVLDEANEHNHFIEQVDDGQLDALYEFYLDLNDFMQGD